MLSKNRRCAFCKKKVATENAKINGLKAFCSTDHALAWLDSEKGKVALKKVYKAKNKEQLEKLKSLTVLKREAQQAFNAWIRLRDIDEPCISCGEYKPDKLGGGWDAGHLRTVKAAPEVRYNTNNVHKQCKHCNNWLSGNVEEYRARLNERIGKERVDKLYECHAQVRYERNYLIRLKKVFQKRTSIRKKIRVLTGKQISG